MLALEYAQGGSDQPAEPRQPGFDPGGDAGDPRRAVVELGEAALGGAELGVLANQQIAQPEDLLLLAGKLLSQRTTTLLGR